MASTHSYERNIRLLAELPAPCKARDLRNRRAGNSRDRIANDNGQPKSEVLILGRSQVGK